MVQSEKGKRGAIEVKYKSCGLHVLRNPRPRVKESVEETFSSRGRTLAFKLKGITQSLERYIYKTSMVNLQKIKDKQKVVNAFKYGRKGEKKI